MSDMVPIWRSTMVPAVYVPLIVSIIGLILHLAVTPRLDAVGLHMFWVGLLVVLLHMR